MKDVRIAKLACAALWAALAMACGTETVPVAGSDCLQIVGQGSTVGTIRDLMGSGTFTFGDVERDGEVGIYLNDIADNGDGTLDLTIIYQFFWDGGDFILTQDPVRFTPALNPDTYSFTLPMTITSGGGMFVNTVGTSPLRIEATVEFGPAPGPGELRPAREEFTLGGRVCVE